MSGSWSGSFPICAGSMEAARTWLALMEGDPSAAEPAAPGVRRAPGSGGQFPPRGAGVAPGDFILRPAGGSRFPWPDGGRILVADDDPGNRDILTRCWSVTDTASQWRPTDWRRSSGSRGSPDLALLDILMPGLDGYQVLLKLKGTRPTVRHPGDHHFRIRPWQRHRRCIEAGRMDYLTKPFNPVLLRALPRVWTKTAAGSGSGRSPHSGQGGAGAVGQAAAQHPRPLRSPTASRRGEHDR